MLDFIYADDKVIMQFNFFTLLFLTFLTIIFYLTDRKSHKIKFLVLGNLSYLFMHLSVLLAINDIVRLPILVALFDLGAVTFYILAFFQIYNWHINLKKLVIYNVVHMIIISVLFLTVHQVSIYRSVTSFVIVILIIDIMMIARKKENVTSVSSYYNLFANIVGFLGFKFILGLNRLYTMTYEVNPGSISSSIIIYSFVLILFIIWLNISILFVNFDLLNSKYRHLSYYDYLTNIPNRRFAAIKLGEAISKSKMDGKIYGLLMIDLNRFKSYNDLYGHDFGDELLVSFSNEFSSLIRSNDVFARYGGDEFLVLLEMKKKEELIYFINRVRQHFKKNKLTEKQIEVEFSVGRVFVDSTTDYEISELIEKVDGMLYKDKNTN